VVYAVKVTGSLLGGTEQGLFVKVLFLNVEDAEKAIHNSHWTLLPTCTACLRLCPWTAVSHDVEDCPRVKQYNATRGGKPGWVQTMGNGLWQRADTNMVDTIASLTPRIRELEMQMRVVMERLKKIPIGNKPETVEDPPSKDSEPKEKGKSK